VSTERTEQREPLGEKKRTLSAELNPTAAGDFELRARGSDEQLVRRSVTTEREVGFRWVSIAIGPHSEDAKTYASASGSSWLAEAVLLVLVVPVNVLWTAGSLVEAPVESLDSHEKREVVERDDFVWEHAKLVDPTRGTTVLLHVSGAGSGGEQSWVVSAAEIHDAGLDPASPAWELHGDDAPPVPVTVPPEVRSALGG
jgi:hypothetical protein